MCDNCNQTHALWSCLVPSCVTSTVYRRYSPAVKYPTLYPPSMALMSTSSSGRNACCCASEHTKGRMYRHVNIRGKDLSTSSNRHFARYTLFNTPIVCRCHCGPSRWDTNISTPCRGRDVPERDIQASFASHVQLNRTQRLRVILKYYQNTHVRFTIERNT